MLAGAGGWGDPLERDPAAVLRDVRNELLSPAKALADYGVVIADAKVDLTFAPPWDPRTMASEEAKMMMGIYY